MIRSIEWIEGKVRFIDQTVLPNEERYVLTDDPRRILNAIKRLEIRGAPLIGIAAAYAVVLAAQKFSGGAGDSSFASLQEFLNELSAARPTAVNLAWATERMRAKIRQSGSGTSLTADLLVEAQLIHEADRNMCRQIADAGVRLLPQGAAVLTHCNTGALATGGEGTALNIVRTGWEQGRVSHVYITETRPLLQGARLTAWELRKLEIPFTLVPDSAAAMIMKQGRIGCVVVGADRIARNGDVANKIGTYALAIACSRHSIPLFVAAPTSSIDSSLDSGDVIPIEERDPEEVRICGSARIAPSSVKAYSPAFDVTPSELVSAIITEVGSFRPPYDFSGSSSDVGHGA